MSPSEPDRASPRDGDAAVSIEGQRMAASISARLFDDAVDPVKLGRFVIVDPIGRGAMGVVYSAYDPDLDRRVALKVLRSELTRSDDARTRMLREARALARLGHPNVLTLFEAGTIGELVFLATEYVEGDTLKGWCERHERVDADRVRRVVDFAIQAARGLAAAHAEGLIHRDFKPTNVLVDGNGRLRVADFGLARELGRVEPRPAAHAPATRPGSATSGASDLTGTGMVVGTPAYMAPEQVDGRVDERSDQFAWGVTFYEALYGERPFEDASIEKLAVVASTRRPRSAPTQRMVPAWLRRLLERTLHTEPALRYASMQALLADLERGARRGQARWRTLGVGACTVAGAAWWLGASRADGRACEEQSQAIASDWDDAKHVALRRAFEASGVPFVGDSVDGTVTRLDTYATRWAELRRQACETASDHTGDWPAALREQSLACFAERRHALAALVDRLVDATPEAVERSVDAAASLPAIDVCTDPAWLRSAAKPPDDASTRERVDETRAELASATAMAETGDYEGALGRVELLLPTALALAHAPLEADVRMALGELLREAGAHEDAVVHLQAAYTVAMRTGSDRVAASAAVAMGQLLGSELSRHADSEQWLEFGEMMLDRSGDGPGLDRARLLSSRAFLRQLQGRFDEALALHREALAMAASVLDEDDPRLATFQIALGRMQVDRGEYDEAMQFAEQARRTIARALGAEHPKVAHAMLLIGSIHKNQGRYDDAIATLMGAEEILEAVFGEDNRDVAGALGNIGNAYYAQQKHDEAIAYQERALAIRRGLFGDFHRDVVASLTTLGLCEAESGDPRAALEIYERTLVIAEDLFGPDHPNVGMIYGNMGNADYALRDYEQAIDHYSRDIANRERAVGPNDVNLAFSLTGLGKAWLGLGEWAKGRHALERALALREAHAVGQHLLAETRFNLAIALHELGEDPERVRTLAEQARAAYTELGWTREIGQVEARFGKPPRP